MPVPKNTIRVTIDLNRFDYDLLKSIKSSGAETPSSEVLRKAIRLLAALDKGEVALHTPEGQKIPNSVIFS